MSDEKILAGMLTGGRERELAIEYLLDTHTGLIKRFRRKYPMESEDRIKDAYVDSILAVLKNVLKDQYKKTGTLAAYLSIIMSNKCKDLSRTEFTQKAQTKKTMEVNNYRNKHWIASAEPNQEQSLILQEQIKKFRDISSAEGSNCWKILEMYFIQGYKMKEIAQALSLASETSARVTKFKCLAKLRQSLAINLQ